MRLPRIASAATAVATALACLTFVCPAGAVSPPSPGALSPATLKLPDGPASVRGLGDDASVNVFNAQIDYAVPLDLPAGPGDFRPKLALAYSGALGNGTIGVGWSLGGVAVRRSLRLGVPAYGASDELELVGLGKSGRLVLIPDGTYRLEGEGQRTKIVSSGDGFVVTTPDGARYVLGTTPAAREEANGKTSAWLLESATDLGGEHIDYSYATDRGQAYLASVAWAPAFRVDLAYAARPDVVTSYRTGFEVTTAARLSTIAVSAFGEVVRTYALAYDDTHPLSRLAGLSMTGRAGATGWPALTFDYGAPQAAAVTPLGNVGGWELNARGVSFADVDGDGLADLLRMEASGHAYKRNLGNGAFADPKPVTGGNGLDLAGCRLVDFDGDLRPDVTYVVGTTWRVRRMTSAAWEPQVVWSGTGGLPLLGEGVAVADVNGDGRADLLSQSFGNLYVRLAIDGGLGPVRKVTPIDVPNGVTLGNANVRLHDMNGDGLVDVVYLTDNWMRVYYGVGDGSFTAGTRASYPWPTTAINLAGTYIADLNRDGVADLVRFGAGNMEWYRGRPALTFDAVPVRVTRPDGVDWDAVVAITDTNGNGSEDVVWSSPRGMWSLDLAGATTFGMLTRIDNGLGKSISIEYAPSAQIAAADEALGKPWASPLPTSMPVPVRMVTRTGPTDPVRAVRFAVRDGFWDSVERRFGGFLFGSQHQESAAAGSVQTIYEQGLGDRRVLRGDPLALRTFDQTGALLLEKVITRDTVAIPALGTTPLARRGFTRSETQQHYEGLAQPVATRVENVQDDQGRTIEEHDLGRLDVTGDEATTFRSYADDDATWVRDAVVLTGTKDATGAIVREKRHTYGDDAQVLPIGSVGKGWLRKVESRLVDPTRGEVWIDDEETTYDPVGNVLARYDGKVWHQRQYDPDGLYVVAEQITTNGRPIVWSASWDRALGAPVQMTGPNGEATFLTYDGFGRIVGRGHTAGLPDMVYAYDWSAPRPKTTSWVYEGALTALQPFAGWSPASGWRESTAVTNGAGELLFTATRLAADELLVSGWVQRDERGKEVFKGEPFQAPALPDMLPPGVAGSTFVYDALGRTVQHTSPTGATKRSAFAAFQVTSFADELAPVTTLLDGLGRIVHTERVIGGAAESVDATYDATGAITDLQLQGGLVHHGFTYDSLGRLIAATDPDNGARTMQYDDQDRLIEQVNGAGQKVDYLYDDVGRVTTMTTADGASFVYHYDVEKDGTSTGRTLGAVAWVEEPSGEVHFAYDQDGRMATVRRIVRGHSIEERRHYAPTGALLSVGYDDGFGFDLGYDAAGRPTRVGTYWQALSLDARGAVIQESFGNGVVQSYDRDPSGQPTHTRIARPSGVALYDATVTRNGFGGITSVKDGDGVGLDHTATFSYDAAGRLTQALLGTDPSQFTFGYAYDGLQNMVSRSAAGPKSLGIQTGTYVYGENGRSPRQLTHVTSSQASQAFDYDAAGRVIADGSTSLVYNAFDELVQALDNSSGTPQSLAQHAYGYDGVRTWTQNADGTEQVWFSASVTDKGDAREHSIDVGGRTVAKVSLPIASLPAPATGPLSVAMTSLRGGLQSFGKRASAPHGPWWGALAAFVAALSMLSMRAGAGVRSMRVASALALVGLAVTAPACSSSHRPESAASARAAWSAGDQVYFHNGFDAGPVIFTGSDGSVLEERRYEPFGAPIDAYRESGGVSTVGDVDFKREPRNALNKETDPNTGWSYHGARWMAPQLARWLTPDPPTKGPDPKFLSAPWDLNPYGYARFNPLMYWDPDGQSWKTFAKGFASGFVEGVVTAVVVAAVVAAAPALGTAIAIGGAAMLAYSVYEHGHEIVATGQRYYHGTNTDADDHAVGNAVGNFVGGIVGGGVGKAAFEGPRPVAPKARPQGTPKPPAEPAPSCTGAACTGGRCFIAGTLVASVMGLVPIEAVHAGDLVLARDAGTGEQTLHRVEETFVRETDSLEDVVVEDVDHHSSSLTATLEHPFWVDGRGWVAAQELAIGDRLVTATGQVRTVVTLRARAEHATVYNFIVEGAHSYFVGESELLVHNGCGDPPHKNSNASTNANHRYEISEKATGDVGKTGISGRPLNANGTSPRANTQVNKLNARAGYEKYEATVVERNIPGRVAAKASEQAATNQLASDGNSLNLQQLPKPQ